MVARWDHFATKSPPLSDYVYTTTTLSSPSYTTTHTSLRYLKALRVISTTVFDVRKSAPVRIFLSLTSGLRSAALQHAFLYAHRTHNLARLTH
jgi:hypothetical protein